MAFTVVNYKTEVLSADFLFPTSHRVEMHSTTPEDDQSLELKLFVKQLVTHSNFLWFAVMNLVQVS